MTDNLAILSGPLCACICAVGLLCILVWALAVIYGLIITRRISRKHGAGLGAVEITQIIAQHRKHRVGAEREGLLANP